MPVSASASYNLDVLKSPEDTHKKEVNCDENHLNFQGIMIEPHYLRPRTIYKYVRGDEISYEKRHWA